MAKKDSILKVLDVETPVTAKVLARVPIDKAAWKPSEKSSSLGQLAGWIANGPAWVADVIAGDGFDVMKFHPSPVPATSAALLQTFESGISAARKALAALDDAAMDGNWNFRLGDKTLNTRSRFDVASLFLIFDAIHHRGQLSVYFRMLGVPVPSIYGPSGDENPFF